MELLDLKGIILSKTIINSTLTIYDLGIKKGKYLFKKT